VDFLAQICSSLSAVVDWPPRLLMEWRDEGGRDFDESSLARSAWKNKKERTVPKGTIDPVVPPGTSGAISRPDGTANLLWKFPGTSYLATLIEVPSSFVSPFHEKTRRPVDYGGQAGTNLCEENLPSALS
jgi:hypothetical protein